MYPRARPAVPVQPGRARTPGCRPASCTSTAPNWTSTARAGSRRQSCTAPRDIYFIYPGAATALQSCSKLAPDLFQNFKIGLSTGYNHHTRLREAPRGLSLTGPHAPCDSGPTALGRLVRLPLGGSFNSCPAWRGAVRDVSSCRRHLGEAATMDLLLPFRVHVCCITCMYNSCLVALLVGWSGRP